MKSFLALVSFVCVAVSTPLSNDDAGQIPLSDGLMTTYPGFSLDLNAQRLIQVDGEAPVWTTELGKVLNPLLHHITRSGLTMPRFVLKLKVSSSSTCDYELFLFRGTHSCPVEFPRTDTQDLGASAHLRLQNKRMPPLSPLLRPNES